MSSLLEEVENSLRWWQVLLIRSAQDSYPRSPNTVGIIAWNGPSESGEGYLLYVYWPKLGDLTPEFAVLVLGDDKYELYAPDVDGSYVHYQQRKRKGSRLSKVLGRTSRTIAVPDRAFAAAQQFLTEIPPGKA